MADVVPRLKRPRGVPVRAGSVRQARFEAGLSLAAVAGADLTRAAIHLIETGKAKPSPATLRLIANRTGKPITFFLEETSLLQGGWPTASPDVMAIVDLVERQLWAEAVQLGTKMLGEVSEELDRPRLLLLLTEAHLMLRNLDAALAAVAEALTVFESARDPRMVVECLDWQAYCSHLNHLPGAVEMGQEALRRCRELDPFPGRTEARILSHVGEMHLHLHHWETGLRYLEAALDASTVFQDLGRMARINHSMAAALATGGRTVEAMSRAHRALNLYAALRDRGSMAILENDIAVFKMMIGDLQGAEGHLMTSLAYYAEAGIENKKSHTYLSLAELHMARGSDDQAITACRDAAALADRLGEHRNVAQAHQYLGQIAAHRGDVPTTDAEFQIAIAILEENQATQRLVECRSAYADVLEERGDLIAANGELRAALTGRSPQTAALRVASA
jgi:tetratricopeptide (TPR) repeat protein